MDLETQERFEQVEELVKENNKLVKKLHRAMVWGRAFRIFYWVLIIGIAVGAFYFIQPYVDQLIGAYDSVRGVREDIVDYLPVGESENAEQVEN